MGGVTVDVNEYVAIEGDESAGVPPDDYLRPGPDQHLDGYHALWFARGRYGSDDYSRMLRQRCLINDLIDEADPLTLLRRYQRLAAAGKEIVRSDIPASLLPAFVELGLRAKSGDVRSVAFINSPQFFSGDPDFEWLAQRVQRALDPPEPHPPPRGRWVRPPRPATTRSRSAGRRRGLSGARRGLLRVRPRAGREPAGALRPGLTRVPGGHRAGHVDGRPRTHERPAAPWQPGAHPEVSPGS